MLYGTCTSSSGSPLVPLKKDQSLSHLHRTVRISGALCLRAHSRAAVGQNNHWPQTNLCPRAVTTAEDKDRLAFQCDVYPLCQLSAKLNAHYSWEKAQYSVNTHNHRFFSLFLIYFIYLTWICLSATSVRVIFVLVPWRFCKARCSQVALGEVT